MSGEATLRLATNRQPTSHPTDVIDSSDDCKQPSAIAQGKRRRTLHRHEIPDSYHEPFIISSYRPPELSVKQCIVSLLQANNETLNVWTHLLSSCWFAWRFATVWLHNHPSDQRYTIPFYIYVSTTVLCPALSASAHCLNALSTRARHICFAVDYLGCSFYAFGCALIGLYCFLPGNFWLPGGGDASSTTIAAPFLLFIYAAVPCALASIAISCYSRCCRKHTRFRSTGRFCAFALPYALANVPMLHRLAFFPQRLPGDAAHLWQYLFAAIGAFFYLIKVPERWLPGRFDVFGHSHMLFHVAAALCSAAQLEGTLSDLLARKHDAHFRDAVDALTPAIVRAYVLVCLGGLAIVALFARRIWAMSEGELRRIGSKPGGMSSQDVVVNCK